MEVLRESIAVHNLPYTVFLGLTLLYWVFVILGALDLEVLDFDLDLDLDADGAGFLDSLLIFLNIGAVPFTIIFSFLAVEMWVGAMLINHFFQANLLLWFPFWLLQIIIFIVLFILCLFITAFLTRPLNRVFVLKREFDNKDLVGKTCRVLSSKVTSTFGTGEYFEGSNCLNLSIRIKEENNSIQKGDEVVILDYDKENNIYYVSLLQ